MLQRANLLRRIISPYCLAALSYVIFLVACVFPRGTYSSYMNEPDYMFMDPAAIGFYSVCVAAFVLGLWIFDLFHPNVPQCHELGVPMVSSTAFVLFPLVVALGFSVASNIILIRSNPDLISLLLIQGGADIKSDIQMAGSLGLAGTYLIGIVWWATWRCDQVKLADRRRVIVKIVQYIALFSVIVSSTLKLGRGELMPVLVGSGIIYLLKKSRGEGVGRSFIIKFALSFSICILALFFLFSFVRDTTDMTRDLIAYTIGSYNRLSALLSDRLRYPYSGRGIYLFSFLGFNNLLNMIVPFGDMLRWPTFMEYWQSEFRAMGPAGLGESAIWAGTFGYIFADLGWFAPVFVFFEGVLCAFVWRSARMGNTLGVILYPWFAFSILFWFGMHYLFDNKVVALCGDIVLLSLYEAIFLRRRTPMVATASAVS